MTPPSHQTAGIPYFPSARHETLDVTQLCDALEALSTNLLKSADTERNYDALKNELPLWSWEVTDTKQKYLDDNIDLHALFDFAVEKNDVEIATFLVQEWDVNPRLCQAPHHWIYKDVLQASRFSYQININVTSDICSADCSDQTITFYLSTTQANKLKEVSAFLDTQLSENEGEDAVSLYIQRPHLPMTQKIIQFITTKEEALTAPVTSDWVFSALQEQINSAPQLTSNKDEISCVHSIFINEWKNAQSLGEITRAINTIMLLLKDHSKDRALTKEHALNVLNTMHSNNNDAVCKEIIQSAIMKTFLLPLRD